AFWVTAASRLKRRSEAHSPRSQCEWGIVETLSLTLFDNFSEPLQPPFCRVPAKLAFPFWKVAHLAVSRPIHGCGPLNSEWIVGKSELGDVLIGDKSLSLKNARDWF